MYEHLSSGITFYDAETIKRFQICVAFNRWLGNTEKTKEITIEDIISGNFNNWPEPFRISVNLKFPEKDIDELRRVRETTQSEIANVFTRWQGEKSKKFRDWFMEEGRSFGRGVLKLYGEAAAKLFKHQIGLISLTAEDISSQILNANATLMTALLRYTSMQKDQEDFKEDFAKVRTFLLSDEMLKVPFIKIGSRLWAAIAERAANDSTRKPPNKGMVSDINMVACLLPYCDAIFVDREMFGLLDYGQVKQEIQKDFKTRVFSASNREDFLKYLENILTEADPKITSMAKELYGEPKPYYTMYEN